MRRPPKPRAKSTPDVEVRARIEELAHGGDGVAIVTLHGERRAVFARGVAVGDDVRLRVDASTRPARGRVLEIVEAGLGRVAPACAHVDRCGGCDWMHLTRETQRLAHAALVERALPPSFRTVPVVSHPGSTRLSYRTRCRLHARASGGRAVIGMYGAGTREAVEVDTCVVLSPPLERARAAMGALFKGAHGQGEVDLTEGAQTPEGPLPVLEIRWRGALAASCFARLEQGVTERRWQGARAFSGDVTRPAVIGDPTPWMQGADGEPLRLAPGGFAQAHAEGNVELGRRLAERVRAMGSDLRIVELYSGAGNLTVVLARHSDKVVAIEQHREACSAAQTNLATRGLVARVTEADASAYAIRDGVDLVVLDPPRKGARAVTERLAGSRVRNVVYISCDPVTLGRDLAFLESTYSPVAVETFEMFPETSHVETLVHLERRKR